jgi:hypothetical protein
MTCFFALELEIAFVNRTDNYRQAIKRTFADLYGVSPGTVDVSWTTGKTIVVHCAGKVPETFPYYHVELDILAENTPAGTFVDNECASLKKSRSHSMPRERLLNEYDLAVILYAIWRKHCALWSKIGGGLNSSFSLSRWLY